MDLADLANELDTMERLRMAEVGEDTPEYRQFMQVDTKCLFSSQLKPSNAATLNQHGRLGIFFRASDIPGSVSLESGPRPTPELKPCRGPSQELRHSG